MRRLSLVGLVWLFFVGPLRSQPLGSLTVTAVSGFGTPITEFRAVLSAPGFHDERGTTVGRVVFDHLARGSYVLQVRSRMYLRRERTVYVAGDDVWFPVVLGVDVPIDPVPVGSFTGRIVGSGDVAQLWLKLSSVFDDTCLHLKPDAKGDFQFRGIPPGRYLLFVYSGDTVVQQKEVTVRYLDDTVMRISVNW